MQIPQENHRAALVVAHPSHELRVHGWLEKAKPYVCVLTDGGGRSGETRLSRTSEVLARAGAKTGRVYGQLTDLELYSAVLKQDADLFVRIVEELTEAFVEEQIDYVLGDAAEGYSVAHDICRIMIGAAVELAHRRHRHEIANFDFLVVGSPDHSSDEEAIVLQLDDAMFMRKVRAAQTYSPKLAADVEAAMSGSSFQGIRRFSEPQLAGEVDLEVNSSLLAQLEGLPRLRAQLKDIIDGVPLEAFRVECLRPAQHSAGTHWTSAEPLFYELYGERLVAAGRYQDVIRYGEHMVPLAQAIRKKIEGNTVGAAQGLNH
jgi:hypothetical protein